MFAKMNKLRNKPGYSGQLELKASDKIKGVFCIRISKSKWSVDLCDAVRHIRCHQATETQIHNKNLKHDPSRGWRPVKPSPVL